MPSSQPPALALPGGLKGERVPFALTGVVTTNADTQLDSLIRGYFGLKKTEDLSPALKKLFLEANPQLAKEAAQPRTVVPAGTQISTVASPSLSRARAKIVQELIDNVQSTEPSEANAAALAAGRELLTNVKRTASAIDGYVQTVQGVQSFSKDLDQARAAIEKNDLATADRHLVEAFQRSDSLRTSNDPELAASVSKTRLGIAEQRLAIASASGADLEQFTTTVNSELRALRSAKQITEEEFTAGVRRYERANFLAASSQQSAAGNSRDARDQLVQAALHTLDPNGALAFQHSVLTSGRSGERMVFDPETLAKNPNFRLFAQDTTVPKLSDTTVSKIIDTYASQSREQRSNAAHLVVESVRLSAEQGDAGTSYRLLQVARAMHESEAQRTTDKLGPSDLIHQQSSTKLAESFLQASLGATEAAAVRAAQARIALINDGPTEANQRTIGLAAVHEAHLRRELARTDPEQGAYLSNIVHDLESRPGILGKQGLSEVKLIEIDGRMNAGDMRAAEQLTEAARTSYRSVTGFNDRLSDVVARHTASDASGPAGTALRAVAAIAPEWSRFGLEDAALGMIRGGVAGCLVGGGIGVLVGPEGVIGGCIAGARFGTLAGGLAVGPLNAIARSDKIAEQFSTGLSPLSGGEMGFAVAGMSLDMLGMAGVGAGALRVSEKLLSTEGVKGV
ncbi:MAG: hypothetical protein IT290_01420, partial [Deltaproteobacteria bacterium]|nr:hypothetical protein [Deltaproteobacteria bacterium]